MAQVTTTLTRAGPGTFRKGAKGEKQFITDGMGVQIPHCMGSEAPQKGYIRQIAARTAHDTAKVV